MDQLTPVSNMIVKQKIFLIASVVLNVIFIAVLILTAGLTKPMFPWNLYMVSVNGVKSSNPTGACPTEDKEFTVKGDSLSGVIENGASVTLLGGYYACNEIMRGDIVVYNFSGSGDPLIKVVRGIPGDKFAIANGNIVLNGQVLKTSKDEPYVLSSRAINMLNLYIKDYKGVIPNEAYLILGNVASGSLDSTSFGLVGKSDISGKVTVK